MVSLFIMSSTDKIERLVEAINAELDYGEGFEKKLIVISLITVMNINDSYHRLEELS